MSLSVAFLKDKLQAQIAPGNDVEFLRLLSEADMRLLEFGKWRWTRTRIVLTPVDGFVTLPADYASILGAQIGDYASEIRAEEYEFAAGGVGDVPIGKGNYRLIDQGLNGDGLRHYKVTGQLGENDTLTLLVHFAPATLYDPDIPDSDLPADAVTITRCPDLAALKNAMLGIMFEEAHDLGQSSHHFAVALKTLDNKERTQRGSARQTLNFRPNGVGVRSIRSFR